MGIELLKWMISALTIILRKLKSEFGNRLPVKILLDKFLMVARNSQTEFITGYVNFSARAKPTTKTNKLTTKQIK